MLSTVTHVPAPCPQTCCIADFQVGRALAITQLRGFGDPRYSRLGSLRYGAGVKLRPTSSIGSPCRRATIGPGRDHFWHVNNGNGKFL
jgi:hypothetical protein